jgi:ABC-type bacteriocin/lantibiotic exporter with double-glycine peptidase domain
MNKLAHVEKKRVEAQKNIVDLITLGLMILTIFSFWITPLQYTVLLVLLTSAGLNASTFMATKIMHLEKEMFQEPLEELLQK